MASSLTRPHIDLLSPEATADPYAVLGDLREHDPLHWSPRHKAWIVTRFDDVEAMLTDPRLSSDRVKPVLARAREEDPGSAATAILEILKSWLVVTDPPEHTRLRKLAAGAFKGQRISAMTEQVRALVNGFIDEFVASGERDLIHGVAYPLPATVIAMMMGVPADERDAFRAWSDELALVAFGAGGDERDDRHERALRGVQEMFDYLRGHVERARANPGDDMISALAAPTEDGDRLDDDELLSMLALLLFAGHETTINATANGVLALLDHPEQLELLREQPELMPRAVEELLRFDGPIKILHRHVLETHERHGRTIAAGDRVFVALAAANRDPDRFDGADTIDITRHPNRHVAFGRGIHACVGAQLARLEMRHNLEGIVERLPDLRLAEGAQLEHVPSLASRSLRDLPVTYGAGSTAPR